MRSLCIALALALTGCSSSAPSKPSEAQGDPAVLSSLSQWQSRLDDPSLRKDAILALQDGVPRVADAAKREEASKEVTAALIDAYEVNANRYEILFALKTLRRPESLPVFRRAAADLQPGKNDRLVALAAEALGEMKDPQSIEVLAPLLNVENSPYLRMQAVRALGSIPDQKVSESLEKVLKTPPDKQERFLAVLAVIGLGNLRDTRRVPALMEALYQRQGERELWPWVTVALVQTGAPAFDQLLAALTGRLDITQKLEKERLIPPGKRGYLAARALGELPPLVALKAESALLAALEDESGPESPREGAAYALGLLGNEKNAEAMAKYLDKGYPTRRIAVARGLAMLGNKAAVPALLKMMQEGVYAPSKEKSFHHPRWEAARAIALIGGEAELSAYNDLLAKEKDAESKKYFEEYRVDLMVAKECGDKADCWRKKLSDPDWKIQEKAAYALAFAKAKGAAKDLAAAYSTTASYEVRRAILFALKRIGPGALTQDEITALLAAQRKEEADPEKRKPYAEKIEEPAPAPEDGPPPPPIVKYKPKQAEYLSGDPITLSDLAFELRVTLARLEPNLVFELPRDWDW